MTFTKTAISSKEILISAKANDNICPEINDKNKKINNIFINYELDNAYIFPRVKNE